MLAALLLATPGCLTRHMWSTYSPAWTGTATALQRSETTRSGALFTTDQVLGQPPSLLWVHETARLGESKTQRLAPTSTAAWTVPTLLDPNGFDILDARVATRKDLRDGYREAHYTELQLTFGIRPGTLGDPMPAEDAPPRWHHALHVCPPIDLPPDALWSSRLEALMPRAVGLDPSWHLEDLRITNANWAPVKEHLFDSERLRAPDLSFEYRRLDLPSLSEQQVIARFRSGAARRIATLPAIACFLLAHCQTIDPDRGICRHHSQWEVHPGRPPALAATATAARSWRSLVPVAETVHVSSRTTYTVPRIDGAFLARVAATPLTLAADIVLGPGTLRLWQAITGTLPPEMQDPIKTGSRTR